jgi:hypothetical protein
MSAAAERHWATLLRAALLGTERNPAPPPPADGSALGDALAAVAAETPETALLSAAALLAAYRRAGLVPARDDRPLAESAAEERASVCPPPATRHLATMLGGTYDALLPEWMEAAARGGFIAPPELLPALLDAATRDERLRAHLPAVAGERGRWLAAQRAEWALVLGSGVDAGRADEPGDGWETLPAEARPGVLAEIRGRDPARGMALLRSTWAAEAPRERAALLQALETGLSMEDEPFLEAALDDRRKEVRTAAAGLLARLAGSCLVARMTERARRWLVVSPAKTGLLAKLTGGAGEPVIELHLPEAVDKAMERDGVTGKPPYGVGERGWWLAQALGAVPPRTWSLAGGCAPRDLVAAAAKTEWRDVLINGWATATLRHRDAEWAEPLVPRPELTRWHLADFDGTSLLEVLPPERAEAVVLATIRPLRTLETGDVLHLVSGVMHPWSAEYTREVLRRATSAKPYTVQMIREFISAWLPRMHLGAALSEAAAHPELLSTGQTAMLHHRHAMLEALKR